MFTEYSEGRHDRVDETREKPRGLLNGTLARTMLHAL